MSERTDPSMPDLPPVPIRASSKSTSSNIVNENPKNHSPPRSGDVSPKLTTPSDGVYLKPPSNQKIAIAIEKPDTDRRSEGDESPPVQKHSSGRELSDVLHKRGSSPSIGVPRRNSDSKKGARMKSHKSQGILNFLQETDVDRVAQIIEDIAMILPGFSDLWTQSSEIMQQEVMQTLTLRLNSMQNRLSQSQGSARSDDDSRDGPVVGKKDRSHRHASESSASTRPAHSRGSSIGSTSSGSKVKRESDGTKEGGSSSDFRAPKSSVLRARYSQSYDKTTPLPILLERERERELHGDSPPLNTDSFSNHAHYSATNSSSSNLSLNLTSLQPPSKEGKEAGGSAQKRLSTMPRLSGAPMLPGQMGAETNTDLTTICKRREVKIYKGHKTFAIADPAVLFRRTNDKGLPLTTSTTIGVLKSMHEICQEVVFVVNSNVRELEHANKNIISNEPVDYNVEQGRAALCDVVSQFGSTIGALILELGIEKKEIKMLDRVRKEVESLKKRGDPSEIDAKMLKIGLFRNLLIKQLQNRLVWLCNTMYALRLPRIALNSSEFSGEKENATIMHLFCLFSSITKLLTKVLDDYETIAVLLYYECEKVDAKLKKEEMERRKARIKTIWDLNQSDQQVNIYRASPIDELIVRGTCMQSLDMYYLDTLVITSLSLGEPPVAFLELLLERFFPPANKFPKDVETQFRLKALKLLRVYLTKNYFHIDPQLQFTLRTFVETKLPRAINNQAHIDSIKDKLNVKENFDLSPEDKKLLPLLIFTESRPFDVLQFFETDVAEQLTLLDLEIFRKIQHYELLSQAWSKPKLQTLAINVTELITRPNKISFWVATCILLQSKVKERVKVLTHFIQIAQKLDEMKSYNTMMGVLAGLNSSAISRLHQTNALLEKRIKTIFEELNAKVNPEKAFKVLRDIMMFCGRPCLPYIGIYLTDLTFIDEGNADTVSVDGVDVPNFPKQQMVCSAIANLTQFQQNIVGEYNLSIKYPLHTYLAELPSMIENDLWELSLEREPRINQT